MQRKVINPWQWQDQFGFVHANEVIGAQRQLICSGQIAVDADGKPMHQGDMQAQVALALDNVEAVLAEAGMTLANVVRLNYYTTDMDAFLAVNDALAARLAQAGCKTASTLLGVSRLAMPELLVEIEATAML